MMGQIILIINIINTIIKKVVNDSVYNCWFIISGWIDLSSHKKGALNN